MSEKRRNKRIIFLVLFVLLAAGILCFRFFAGEEKLSENWADKLSYSGLFPVERRSDVQGLRVEFINVGQGDSALIVCNGKYMLVDSGEEDYYRIVESHLDEYGVEKLDIVVATHPHSDHIGSMSRIIEKYEIGAFIMPEVEKADAEDSEIYAKLCDALENKGIKTEFAAAGREYTLSDAGIRILSPSGSFENLNDMSVVFMLTYGDSKFLFTGDIEEDGENALLEAGADLKCDVLKIAHSGSDTSTSEDFLKKASPRIAVISVGKDNEYGHPKRKIIERLLKSDVLIYRTDYDGTVSFSVPSEESEIIKD